MTRLCRLVVGCGGTLLRLVGVTAPNAVFAEPTSVVEVSDVEDLYAVLGDPEIVGTIQLSPGVYRLTSRDSSGQPRANRGSLLLRDGVQLVGANTYLDYDADGVFDARDDDGDGAPDIDAQGRRRYADPQTETIIDGAALDVPEPGIGLVSAPILVLGGGEFSISDLTVHGSTSSQAEVEVRTPGNDVSSVTVQRCTIELGRRGILIDSAPRWGSTDGSVVLTAERNVIRDHVLQAVTMGWGIHLQATNASGTEVTAHLRRNRITGNKVGLLLSVMGMQNSETAVVSQGNVYENAVLLQHPTIVGNLFSGGIFMEHRDSPTIAGRGSDGNRLRLASIDDSIWNNKGWAGLHIGAVDRTRNGTVFSGNEIAVELLGTRFVKLHDDGAFDGPQNADARVDPGKTVEDQPMRRRDIVIVGVDDSGTNLREPPPGGLSGPASGNRVKLLVRNATSSLMPTDYDPSPQPLLIIDNAPSAVQIMLTGSLAAFGSANTGF